ncbi:MAG: nucleoside phosphorylase [Bacteroidota bacterium]
MPFEPSELILNPDGSIYHLNLLPEDLADTVITVGDPERVASISKHFDRLEVQKIKREFCTHTGWYNNKRITVISTGIGTDNIDIVFNELDALANINFNERTLNSVEKKLSIIRIGTSGAIQDDIPINSLLVSDMAIGYDGLLHFYESDAVRDLPFEEALTAYMKTPGFSPAPYIVESSTNLKTIFEPEELLSGVTLTNAGFYGPQGRTLRLTPRMADYNAKLSGFEYMGKKITNFEMETAGIYGMARLLGHEAISLNAILANRITGEFSKNPNETISKLITLALERISQ